MSDDSETPPVDEDLVARPFEGFERDVTSPAPERGSLSQAFFSFGCSGFVALVVLPCLLPPRPRTGSTRTSHERRLERERAIAEAEVERDSAH